jgi:hypothetical protein
MSVLQPPAVPLFVAGTTGPNMPATLNSLVRDPLTFLLAPPRARLRRAGALAVAEGVHQWIPWDTADEDPAGGWTIADPTKYTAQAPGWYTAATTISISGTGAAGLVLTPSIAVNGASNTGVSGGAGQRGVDIYPPTGVATQPKVSNTLYEVYANLGDIIQLDLVYSVESAIVAVDTTAGLQCALELVWAGL